MKCLVKKEAAPGLWLEDRPIPTVGDEEVLIKTKKMSICGTDLHIYQWDAWAQKTIPTPMVVGHEFMGEIVAMGKNVRGLHIGDRVSGEGHITCGRCPNCLKGRKHLCSNTLGVGVHRHGSFAEYFALPAENVFLLPASIPDNLAAIFDPFGNAVHTALSTPLVSEDVLIAGAGPIGIMAAAVARFAGARSVVITDVNDYRLELARQMGATEAINVAKENLATKLPSMGIEHGFTVGMEMSGTQAGLSTLLETMQPGGHISLLGILPSACSIDWNLVIFKMLTLKGIYGREIFSTWFQMTHMLESGLELSPIITHTFSFDDFQKGFDAMLSGKAGKVILEWS